MPPTEEPRPAPSTAALAEILAQLAVVGAALANNRGENLAPARALLDGAQRRLREYLKAFALREPLEIVHAHDRLVGWLNGLHDRTLTPHQSATIGTVLMCGDGLTPELQEDAADAHIRGLDTHPVRLVRAQAEVLCWLLRHAHNPLFQQRLDAHDRVLPGLGVVMRRTS